MNNIDKIVLTSSSEGNAPILDSKHIIATKKVYDIKLVDCKEYCLVYLYHDRKVIKDNSIDTTDLELKKSKIANFIDDEKTPKKKSNNLKHAIEERSIIRSKLACQRIAKANINIWKTFITLTFSENIIDLNYAKKRLKYFLDKVRRVKKDLKFLGIIEFQKRGAVHYHILTNIDINDTTLIYSQEDNSKFKHIKYWNDGFTNVKIIKGDVKKIIGYIAKYMTKNIDDRLFNHRRYFYSKNLDIPKENYIDLTKENEKKFYNKKIQDKVLIYHSEYINPYDNTSVTFLEYKVRN